MMWYENGYLKVKGQYKNHKMHGRWTLYDNKGKQDYFVNGKNTTSKDWSSKIKWSDYSYDCDYYTPKYKNYNKDYNKKPYYDDSYSHIIILMITQIVLHFINII